MTIKRQYYFWVLISMTLLVGCRPTSPPQEITTGKSPLVPTATRPAVVSRPEKLLGPASRSPVATPVSPLATPVSPLASPTSKATGEPQLTPQPGTEKLVAQARKTVAELPGVKVSPDAIELVAIESKQWRDTSLGCPRAGQMYNQVITPGYLIRLEANGHSYEFHTNTRDRVVLCFIDGQEAVEVLSPDKAK